MADKDKTEVSLEFDITHEMVAAFARLTGDFNSLHVDEEVARKSRFRQTIVHGMLPFSFIAFLQNQFPLMGIRLKKISTRFKRPVFPGDRLRMELTCQRMDSKKYSFKGEWKKIGNNEILIVVDGCFCVVDQSAEESVQDSNRTGFLLDKIDENQFTLENLKGKTEEFSFQLSHALNTEYVTRVLLSGKTKDETAPDLCTNLVATLLLSTMVGMRLPGRYATFTRFEINFETDIEMDHQYVLEGFVDKVSSAAGVMEATVEFQNQGRRIGGGKVEVMLNAPPVKMVPFAEISENHLDFGLAGKVVLVTGASRGIGETTVKLFAALGSKVVVNYFRGKGDAAKIVDEIRGGGGEACSVQCDITQEGDVRRLVTTVLEKYGRIDVLVNNAVKDFTPQNIMDLDWQDYLQELEVAVKGMHTCCKGLIPIFKSNGGGKIINLSTVAVDNPVAGQSRYITAKSAVVGYTKSLAKELIKYNIQANLVVPNMTDTDLLSAIPSMLKERTAKSRPYQRHVLPIEVAQCIAFLASRWADAITGQKVVLNLGEPPFA